MAAAFCTGGRKENPALCGGNSLESIPCLIAAAVFRVGRMVLETNTDKKRGISAAALKWTAVVTMLVDHFAFVYWQTDNHVYVVYRCMRLIGRIAFPIYCFLLVEGFFHTRNAGRYIRNCFLFAVISEIPFNMAIFGKVFYPRGQNVYFTLAIGLCALWVLERFRGRRGFWNLSAQAAVIAAFAYAGELFEVDYHWKGILFIIMFYYCRGLAEWVRNAAGICAFAYELTAPLALILIHFYNGERGKQKKYLFYAIYPVHLLIFGLLRFYISGLL